MFWLHVKIAAITALVHSSIQKIYTLLLCCLYILSHSNSVHAANIQPAPKQVYVIDINQEIIPSAQRILKTGIENAHTLHADFIILKLNTFGGLLDVADSMSAMILHCNIPVIVYITKNAASAGALISISCDSIYMAPAATIGAATVVNESQQALPDKYQSYMRGLMRSAAESTGRNPLIAEGMVSPNNAIPSIADSGRIITLTTSEAIANGYCNDEVNSVDEIVKKLCGTVPVQINNYTPTWTDHLIDWLTNPTVSSILLLLIIGGLYFEFQHPGIGLPLFACIIGAVLYFAPLYLDGLAQNWEILLFVIGLVLIVLEIFVVPGFGITGISGIIFLMAGLSLSLVRNNNFDFNYSGPDNILYALLRVTLTVSIAIAIGVFFGGNIFKGDRMKKLVLTEVQSSSQNILSHQSLIGKTGTALTDLRPSGKVIINDEVMEAFADGPFIEHNEPVYVTDTRANTIVVKQQKLS